MELVVRLIHSADIPKVKELQDDSFPIEYSPIFYENIQKSNYLSIIICEKSQNEENVIAISTSRQYEKSNFVLSEKTSYLSTFCVREDHRKHGIGGYLLDLTCLISKCLYGCSGISLHTESRNETAINFYKNHGFNIARYLPQYYSFNGERHDAVIMYLDLKDVNDGFINNYDIKLDPEIMSMLNSKRIINVNPKKLLLTIVLMIAVIITLFLKFMY